MMMMRRREGEKILIGDDIVLHITHIGRNRVRIGIDAPRDLAIVAEEVKRVEEANTAAAQTTPSHVLSILGRLPSVGQTLLCSGVQSREPS